MPEDQVAEKNEKNSVAAAGKNEQTWLKPSRMA
jgi:hypothetical protein